MSDLTATNCGCGCDTGCSNNCGSIFGGEGCGCSIIWILILLNLFCGNNRSGNQNECGFGGNNSCLLILLLLFCCGDGCGSIF